MHRVVFRPIENETEKISIALCRSNVKEQVYNLSKLPSQGACMQWSRINIARMGLRIKFDMLLI
jgi:hypothetical protein